MLYEGGGEDKISAKMLISNDVIKKYENQYPMGEMGYPDLEIRERFWDEYLFEQKDIEDNSVPSAYMSEFDKGLYARVLGAETWFIYDPDWGWVSSMSVPFLKEAKDLLGLVPDLNGEWSRRYVDQLRFFSKRAKDKYGISHFILKTD